MPRVSTCKLALALVLLVSLGTNRSEAGPTKYDPKTKSFPINYTFAALPSFGMPPEQIAQLGEIQKATDEQETQIRTIYQSVSKILEDVTSGRAKIGSFNYVDNVKQADVIISLTGKFDRAAWAVSGGVDGKPGQVGLYYLYLEDRSSQEIANTVGHELCHYLFALPDEYASTAVAECPLQNPESPGCLMDNYFARHGFRRLCSEADHNPDGPLNNPSTIVQGHKAQDSCQYWVDQFFKDHPPDPNAAAAADPAAGPAGVLVGAGSLDKLVNSATLKVREDATNELQDLKVKNKPPTALSSGKLAALAKKFINEQIKQLIGDPAFAQPNNNEINQAVQKVVDNVTSGIEPDVPSRFNADIIARLKSKASELANALPANERDLVQALLAENRNGKKKNLKPMIGKVAADLVKFAATIGMKSLIGLAPPTPQQSAEEKLYIEKIARDAVLGRGVASENALFYKAAKLHIQVSRQTAETVNALANELDVPGAAARKNELQLIKADLDALRLPGRTQSSGKRRTYIVAPMPLDPNNDRLRINAGDNLYYRDIRDMAVSQIRRLIRRERVEIVATPPAANRLIQPDQTTRFSDFITQIQDLEANVRRDRAENIIMFIPPGGIPQRLEDELEKFRILVLENDDVRVDAILFGEKSTIPLRLRDLVAQTGGSVQSAVDLDEIGAVAQRIETEIRSGSWVTTPQQGYILLSNLTRDQTNTLVASLKKPPAPLSINEFIKKYAADIPKEGEVNRSEERLPILTHTIDEIDKFNKRLLAFIDVFVRQDHLPPEYQNVNATYSGLVKLRKSLDRMKMSLTKLVEDPVAPNTNDSLDAILLLNYETKQSLRGLFGSETLFKYPLTSTDDYMDWTLRKLLLQEARELKEQYLDPYGKLSLLRNQLTIDIVHLWQRTTSNNQKLADITSSMFNAYEAKHVDGSTLPIVHATDGLSESIIEKTLREEFLLAPGASSLLFNAVELLQFEIDLIQREAENEPGKQFPRSAVLPVWNNPPFINLAKTFSENDLKREIHARYDGRTNFLVNLWKVGTTETGDLNLTDPHFNLVNDRIALHHAYYKYLEFAFINLSAQILKTASSIPNDYNRFSAAISTMVSQYGKMDQTQMPDIPASSPFAALKTFMDKRSGPLKKTIVLLETRKENQLDSTVATLGQSDATKFLSSLESNDTVAKENGLTPVLEALQSDEDIDKNFLAFITPENNAKSGKPIVGDDFQTYLEKCNDLFNSLGLDWFANHNDVRERAEQITNADFPRLILDTLGRLRELEVDLRTIKQNLKNDPTLSPVTERVERALAYAKPNFDIAKDGHILEIDFEPFQVEELAEFEIIIGLSRPLSSFKELLKLENQPKLRLYKNREDSRSLIDQPYLRVDPDVSTENMLVFRVPLPMLKAGYLNAGKYYVSLMIDKKHMPILSKDNTMNYTFSVATPRPNVQLIAALRQTQPKEGDIDLTKDKEYAFRGSVGANLSEVIVEVEVLAGAPVINADVSGRYQMINDNETIALPSLKFVDDGLYPDFKASDGVYTTRITLPPTAIRKPTEYRLYIEARSNDQDVYIPLAELIPTNEKPTPTAPKNTEAPEVPEYQRSTSLNFHVSTEN